MKKITFDYKDTKYTLEFTRAVIREMEDNGFSIYDVDKKIVKSADLLFRYAFMKNHSDIDDETYEEILELFEDKEELLKQLIEMVAEAVNTLTTTKKSKNAIKWTVK